MKQIVIFLLLAVLLGSCSPTPEVSVPTEIIQYIDVNQSLFLENCNLTSLWGGPPPTFESFPVQDSNVTRVASYYSKSVAISDTLVTFNREGTTVTRAGKDITGTDLANQAVAEAVTFLNGVTVIKVDFTVSKLEDVIIAKNFQCISINPR